MPSFLGGGGGLLYLNIPMAILINKELFFTNLLVTIYKIFKLKFFSVPCLLELKRDFRSCQRNSSGLERSHLCLKLNENKLEWLPK
jgi:hypothetical protein